MAADRRTAEGISQQDQEMQLYDHLDALLTSALTLSGVFVGIFIVVRFIHKKSQPFILEMVSHLLLICYLLWFAAYAISTRMELDLMNAVFDPKDLPGLSISYPLLALGFSIFFTLLIITHRNLFISFPLVMLLGFSDLFGNLSLITGMQLIARNRFADSASLSGAELVWFNYYLDNPQLVRIATYMLIAFLGFLIFLPSRVQHLKVTYLNESLHKGIPLKMAFFQKHWLKFEVVGKLVFCSAILSNEITMWYWRYLRGLQLHKIDPGSPTWTFMDAFK